LAAQTPHIVLSTTLKSVSWPTAQIVRDVAELRTLKRQPGKNVYVVGGAILVASLLNEDLLDELRLIVHPIVLGKGQALFRPPPAAQGSDGAEPGSRVPVGAVMKRRARR
jgi:dihydrofolate reductase